MNPGFDPKRFQRKVRDAKAEVKDGLTGHDRLVIRTAVWQAIRYVVIGWLILGIIGWLCFCVVSKMQEQRDETLRKQQELDERFRRIFGR